MFFSVALDMSWRASVGRQSFSGLWPKQEATEVGLLRCVSLLRGKVVGIFCDSATAVMYL